MAMALWPWRPLAMADHNPITQPYVQFTSATTTKLNYAWSVDSSVRSQCYDDVIALSLTVTIVELG